MRHRLHVQLHSLLLLLFLTGCGSGEVGRVPNLGIVEEGVLLRGGQPRATGLAVLRDRYGVKTVINLNPKTIEEEQTNTLALGMDYLPLPMDAFNLSRADLLTFLTAVEAAEAAGRTPVYVHCQFGQDRTGMVIGTYRIVAQGWTAEQAIAEKDVYQDWLHDLVFRHIEGRLRETAGKREAWQACVEFLPPPSIVRAPAATVMDDGHPREAPPATHPAPTSAAASGWR